MYMHSVHQVLFPEYRLPTEAEWEMQLQLMVREYNIYKGQKKYPWSGSYTRSGDKDKGRSIS
jgi:formylglycine-generating enzyme required for sulfatase activity